jgi:hypothetical protein
MKVIGGYFELELAQTEEFHKDAIKLNTGRNAFEYILRTKQYQKVFLPFYSCEAMLEPIKKLKIEFQFYSIDKRLKPIFDYERLKKDEVFVYTNYFGLCNKNVRDISRQVKNLIIDNSQAFFARPLPEIDTFYSARKFFGVPDGAYLYTNNLLNENLEIDKSYLRFQHLLGRIDNGAEDFYSEFRKNDDELCCQPIKQMSKITEKCLSSINYNIVCNQRKINFVYLHQFLSTNNKLIFSINKDDVPMVYPFWISRGKELKNTLIQNNIFVATYWPNVLTWCKKDQLEFSLTENIINIPIDQRYNVEDMRRIVNLIREYV